MQQQINQMINRAVQNFQTGKFEEAELILLEVLKLQSRNFDALHLVGVIKGIKNQHHEALEYFRKAIRIDPQNSYLNFNIAKAFSEIGEEERALKYYSSAIKLDPSSPEGWLNYGKSLLNCNKLEESLCAYNQALVLDPEYAEALCNRGNVLLELKQYVKALVDYDKALSLKPNLVIAWCNRANVLLALKKYENALVSYDNAISIDPHDAIAWYSRGNALSELKQYEEAVVSYDKAISIKPDDAIMWFNRGNALSELKQYQQAVFSYDKAINIKPGDAIDWYNRGNSFLGLMQYEQAIISYDTAININPNYEMAWYNRGNAFSELKNFEQAVVSYDKGISIKPDDAIAWWSRANALLALNKYEQALISYDRGISISPDNAVAWYNRGNVLSELKKYEEAVASYDKALALNPEYAEAWWNRGNAHCSICQFEEVEASYREAIRINPDNLLLRSSWLHTLNYLSSFSSIDLLAESRNFGLISSAKAKFKFTEWNILYDIKKLRIGFVSGDFSNHSVGYFIENFIKHIDSSQFEIYAFSTQLKEDDLTGRIKPYFKEWTRIHGESDFNAASIVHQKGIHILIDLSGHTTGNRLPVFSFKPAPVQATWLGLPATTGVTEIDFVIADHYAMPAGYEKQFTETIWRLPESYLCLTPPSVEVNVGKPPVLTNHFITFGSFNNLSKINNKVIEVWSTILKSIPNSKLLLKNKQLCDNKTREVIIKNFLSFGVDSNRLLLMDVLEDRSHHLAEYCKIDIALDTFPYPGVTTSAEALWMGVPVLSLLGSNFLSGSATSIAKNVGLDDWIAYDVDDYINKAVAFSSEIGKLVQLRSSLREHALRSPLFDAPRFAKNFGDALWGMWHHCINTNGIE